MSHNAGYWTGNDHSKNSLLFFYKTRGLKLPASEVWRTSVIKMPFGFWFQIWYMLNFINIYMDESYIEMHVILRNLLAITSNFDLLSNWYALRRVYGIFRINLRVILKIDFWTNQKAGLLNSLKFIEKTSNFEIILRIKVIYFRTAAIAKKLGLSYLYLRTR